MADDDNDMHYADLDAFLTLAEQLTGDRSAIEKIIVDLEEIFTRCPSPATTYALAYVWYCHPARMTSLDIQHRVEELLCNVVKEKPNDYCSWLYLGHNCYDRGDFKRAREFFEEATKFAPRSYLGLKSFEMVVCCYLACQDTDASLISLEQFVSILTNCEVEDIWPQELAKALSRNMDQFRSSIHLSQLVRLARRLDGLGHFNRWFTDIARRQPTTRSN